MTFAESWGVTNNNAAQPSVNPAALYSPKVVGELIGFHEESIRRLVRDDRIEAIHVGRNVRIPGAVVLQILSQGLPSKVAA